MKPANIAMRICHLFAFTSDHLLLAASLVSVPQNRGIRNIIASVGLAIVAIPMVMPVRNAHKYEGFSCHRIVVYKTTTYKGKIYAWHMALS